MKTNLHTPEDYQMLKLALYSRCGEFYALRQSFWDEGCLGVSRPIKKDGVWIGSTYKNRVPTSSVTAKFGLDETIEVGYISSTDLGEAKVGEVWGGGMQPRHLQLFLKKLIDALTEKGFKDDTPFWPGIDVSRSAYFKHPHFLADEKASWFITSLEQGLQDTSTTSMNLFDFIDRDRRSVWFRASKSWVDVHPFTVGKMKDLRARLGKSRTQEVYSPDTFQVQVRQTCRSAIEEAKDAVMRQDYSKVDKRYVTTIQTVLWNTVKSALAQLIYLKSYELGDELTDLVSKLAVGKLDISIMMERLGYAYKKTGPEPMRAILREFLETEAFRQAIEASRMLIDDPLLPDFRYIIWYI